jgi:hypothetical protein
VSKDIKGMKAMRLEKRRMLLESRAEEVEKLEIDLRERFIFLIDIEAESYGRYEYLEKRYGISGRRWQNVCNRVQMPGIDMLSSILKDQPQYATWLMCGEAINRKTIISIEGGKPKTGHQLQRDPFSDLHIDPIDLTMNGWEEKVSKALWQSIQKRADELKEKNDSEIQTDAD